MAEAPYPINNDPLPVRSEADRLPRRLPDGRIEIGFMGPDPAFPGVKCAIGSAVIDRDDPDYDKYDREIREREQRQAERGGHDEP